MHGQQQLTAIRLNNISATHLQEGNYELALNVLAEGLQVSKQLLKSVNTGLTKTNQEDDSQGINLDSFMVRDDQTSPSSQCTMDKGDDIMDSSSHSCMSSFSSGSASTYCDEQADDEFFLYRHPIHLPESTGVELPLREDTCTAISAALIFNMALANQLLTTAELYTFGDLTAAKERLERSAKLYELAYNLQERNEVCLSPLFMMAIINNLGLIYQSLDQKDTACNCFQHLLTTLMFVTDYEHGDGTVALDGFFRNTTHLISQPCPAPAA